MRARSFVEAAAMSLAISAAAPDASSAAVIYDVTRPYGDALGRIDPSGSDALNPNSVVVNEASASPFVDRFDFRSLPLARVDEFRLTLTYDGAGFSTIEPLEFWSVCVRGPIANARGTGACAQLRDAASPQTVTLSYFDTDPQVADAFGSIFSQGILEFDFVEFAPPSVLAPPNEFTLVSARLRIEGEFAVPVPLPAALPLLATALGGLALVRRRGRA